MDKLIENNNTKVQSGIQATPNEIDFATSKSVTKQQLWERKLLDLSLRNSLLSFRPNASSVQILAPDLAALEDEIASGADFVAAPVPDELTVTVTDNKIFEVENGKETAAEIAENEFKKHRLRTFFDEDELSKTMKKLQRQAKISIEENGANTLYLALGFLRWYEDEKSAKPRYAPLVLVPVDIVRKMQDRSYSIRARDEETQMNITVLEMLRQFYAIDIAGLNPLPADENGINLSLVFDAVRQGIACQKNWEIEEMAFLGQFSFSRFIMWNDIRARSDDLQKNKVVKSLISGKAEWQFDNIKISADELDKDVKPSDMAVPTSADSSQLAAIYEAARGESFVLHGPPGTGKSQTITNMIANALYNGKSVLFVAEKMAALTVVQKRLEKIGLAPFCLELHSNKAQKKSVLGQLEKTLETGHIKAPEAFLTEADRLYKLRCELNETMTELHRKQKIGFSLYDAITKLEALSDYANKIGDLLENLISSADETTLEVWNDAVRNLAALAAESGSYSALALKNIHLEKYAIEQRERLKTLCSELLSNLKNAQDTFTMLANTLKINAETNYESYNGAIDIAEKLLATPYFLNAALDQNAFAARKSLAQALIGDCEKLKALESEISVQFEPSILNFDADSALLEWKKTQQKWALGKHFGTKKQVNELALYAKNPASVNEDNIAELYAKLSERKRLEIAVASPDIAAVSVFGALWLGKNSDTQMLSNALENSEKTVVEVEKSVYKDAFKNLLSEPNGLEQIKPSATSAIAGQKTLKEALKCLESEFAVDLNAVTTGENWFGTATAEAEKWSASTENLRDRVSLENALTMLDKLGLSAVSNAYKTGSVNASEICDAFTYEVSKQLINLTVKQSAHISTFSGAKFDDTIAKFKEASEQFQKLTIQELCARLSAKIPTCSSAAGSSEISILQKAIKSGGRMMPIRKLFDSVPNLLRRICPCMLMSPISVAQYIDPSFPKFDLVIFDEASQLPTCEAVGAIARGENVVVVGDPKQLPPTSFFNANQTDEENYEQEDLESVLDDCLALAMPQTHLLWHYRSRHESLIAFSNAKYYDNKLLTFPSPDDLVSEVKWVHVDGCYDKGGTKQNPAEAEAIVNEIARRLKDEKLRNESIGVVTFSSVQQILIDDMLTEALQKEPELLAAADAMYEPILVKNLENVQGDERDVILFSVGYGPDKDGKVTMNFGPLNRDGGWRRLNVAISRSRKSMTVYSVITPEQIDLTKTHSDGVAGLKGFLEFAARGKNEITGKAETSMQSESFEQLVATEIKNLGYEAKCSIGTSEYKIDIGVINPEAPETYVLGIMCDNGRHMENTTARDRSILQPSVLRGLGWNIATVHILDWLDNKNKVLGKLEIAIKEAITAYQKAPEQCVAVENAVSTPLVFEKEEPQSQNEVCNEFETAEIGLYGTPESFHEPQNKDVIVGIIRKAVEEEAPLSQKALYKRVLSAWSITRTSPKVEATFGGALAAAKVKYNESNGGVFLWRDDQNPSTYSLCRESDASADNKRAMDDICAEEIANGVINVLKNQISLEKQDLIRETAALFGFTRIGEVVETSVTNGINYAVSTEKARLDESGRYTLV